jgi:ABC-type uncharacterized transport system substrate-binding protein
MKYILSFIIFIIFFCSVVSVNATERIKYKIAYYEAGEYGVYTKTWDETKNDLKKSGLLDKIEIKYYESPGWSVDNSKQEEVAKKLMADTELDMIVGMGTIAVENLLKYNNNKTPILGMGLSDALKSGFIKNLNDTGIDNFTTRHFPKRWLMLIDTFYNLVKFKNVGLLFANTSEGHVYANYKQWSYVANKYGFKISIRYVSEKEGYEEVKQALEDLIKKDKIDAFYISAILPFDFDDIRSCKLLKILYDNQIYSFSRDGLPHVKKGALLGLTGTDWVNVGKFHGKQIREILVEDKRPRDIDFVYNNRLVLAINLKTLKHIKNNKISPGHYHLFEQIFTNVCWEE